MALAVAKNDEIEKKPRLVPAFSIASYRQKNVHTGAPPLCGAWTPRPVPPTMFQQCYLSCDCPIQLEFVSSGQKLSWKVEIERLDFGHFLPIFFGGLMEFRHPYSFMARQGVHDMLTHGGAKVVPVIPQLIGPITVALNTRNRHIMAITIKALQMLLKAHPSAGLAMLPYYRQLLPVFALFKNKNVNLGDGVEYNQRKRINVADLVAETLQMLEESGGPDARLPLLSPRGSPRETPRQAATSVRRPRRVATNV